MTETDKKLIEQAEALSRWDYREIDRLIRRAETEEARQHLIALRWELYDLCLETL